MPRYNVMIQIPIFNVEKVRNFEALKLSFLVI